MFSTKNGSEYKYDFSARKFRVAFEFLKRKDLADLEPQWIELEEGVRASIQRYDSFGWEENRFETHEKYFDVQYVIEGMELCGVCDRSECKTVAVPYNALINAREDMCLFPECRRLYYSVPGRCP